MLKNFGHHDHLGELPTYSREIRCGITPQIPIHSNNAFCHHYARVSEVESNIWSQISMQSAINNQIDIFSHYLHFALGSKTIDLVCWNYIENLSNQ